jgi:hypothetical protein
MICATGATLSQIEPFLEKKISRFLLKYYLFYLIELDGISYGKIKNKYFTEHKGFELMNQINQECISKNTRLEKVLITFEIVAKGGLNKYR